LNFTRKIRNLDLNFGGNFSINTVNLRLNVGIGHRGRGRDADRLDNGGIEIGAGGDGIKQRPDITDNSRDISTIVSGVSENFIRAEAGDREGKRGGLINGVFLP